MEQIVKKDGRLYYGDQPCRNADDAYCRFRNEYHASLGRRAYHRLNRFGQREERIHDNGFVFEGSLGYEGDGRADVYILGLMGLSYCRMLGGWSVPCEDEQFEPWFDWAFSKGSGALRIVGRKQKTGRTSKRLKTKFR